MLKRTVWVCGVVISLALAGAADVRAADLYTVEKLQVDAVGVSPSEARDKALASGRVKAFGIMFKRLTQQALWANQPALAPDELDEMVSSFVVDNERHSTTRYLADASYTFSAAGVRSALRRFGLTFSETIAKPIVVLPIKPGVGWVSDSLWAQSWNQVSRRGSLKPVIVPLADAAEVASVGNVIPEAATWQQVTSLAEKYAATEVWITTGTRTATGISISVVSLRSDSRKESRFNIAAAAGEADGALFVRAAAMVRASYEESWKSQTAVDFGSQSTLDTAVAFKGLPEWVSIRRELSDISLIQKVSVNQMLTQGARLRLDYLGRIEQLQAALRQADLNLTDNGSGVYVLARIGTDISALPAALMEPPSVPVPDPAIGAPAGAVPTPLAPAATPPAQ